MTDLRADKPDTAGAGLPRGVDGQWASQGLGKKSGSALRDAAGAAYAPTTENTNVGASARRRQHCEPIRMRLRGCGCRHRVPRSFAYDWLGRRFNLAALIRASSARFLSRLLQFGAKFGDGLLLRFQHPEQF